MTEHSSQQEIKRSVGRAAADLVEAGMLVGLGTGSTAQHFIARLIERHSEGLPLTAVATSKRSAEQAAAGGIRVIEMDEVSEIDMTVDGADEIDPQKRMIKGGGGALLREKLVASASKEMVVIVDASKLVDRLGRFPLPVEVVRFGAQTTLKRIEALGYRPVLRKTDKNEPFVTDEGHYIADIPFDEPLDDPEQVHRRLIYTVGVVETGFFFGLAKRVIVGHSTGKVEIL